MRKVKKIILLFVVSVSFVISMMPISAQAARQSRDIVIENMDIHMDVHEDGTIDVVEKYRVNFSRPMHGFFRNIAEKYTMEWEIDGKKVKRDYFFPITNIECNTAYNVNEDITTGVNIRLGDSDKYVQGIQNYVISYKVEMRDLRLDGKQKFYWNLVGKDMEAPIEHMSYTIQMPKAIDEQNVFTYTGIYGSTNNILSAQVNQDKTVITGQSLERLNAYHAATIEVNLENGYFTFPKIERYGMISSIIAVVVFIIFLVLFYLFGRDEPVIKIVEFTAPKGLTSADVGFIIDNSVETKDITSLIIDWANRGLIKIHDDDKKTKLEKLPEADESQLESYEKGLFQALFEENDLIDEKELSKPRVTKAIMYAKRRLRKKFERKENRILTRTSKMLQIVVACLYGIPFMVAFGFAFYGYYKSFIGFAIGAFGLVIFAGVGILLRLLANRRHSLSKHIARLAVVGFILIDIAAFAAAIIILFILGVEWYYIACLVATLLLMQVIIFFMDKHTEQGNAWLGQILGLKEYIELCEKDRLEMLVHDNPMLFFDILPYAYVLGVSSVWAKKFENIAITAPGWYVSNSSMNTFTTFLWWQSMNRSLGRVNTAVSYQSVSSKSASSGFGGGSFGGGGGGGFSGGGFGGGGGGGW